MTIRLPANGWQPRYYQLPLWQYLQNGGKRAVACFHRRAGKDEVALHWAGVAAFSRVATYWHMLPEASQARKAIWDAVNPHTGKRRIEEAFPDEIIAARREQEMLIKFKNGSTWQVVGSDNYNSLVGSPPVGVVYSEWSLANPLSWGYIRPILAENGGWSLFIYTPRGRNHGASLYEAAEANPEWFCQRLTVDDTDVFSASTIAQERVAYIREHGEAVGNALFQQEYYCSFTAAVLGAVYGEWIDRADREGRIASVAYDPAYPVETAWDLGYDDSTAIWFFQRAHNEVRFIDYYETSQADIEHYCDVLKGKPYRYGDHFVPHDAANKLLAAGGRSIVQQAYALGVKMRVVAATSQMNSIAALRKVLGFAWFDKEACAHGIEALRQYKFDYDEQTKSFKVKPLHDWSSHGSDAAELVGQVYANAVRSDEKPKPRFLHEITASELFFPEKTGINYRERI